MAATVAQCQQCRGLNRPGAVFCRHCGNRLGASVSLRRQPAGSPVRAPAITGDEVLKRARALASQAVAWHDRATVSSRGLSGLYAGGALVLVGSFLPLASSGAVGRGLALIPDVAGQVGSVYLVPLVALVLVALAMLIPQLALPLRSVSAGACIALASPGVLLTWTFIRVGNSLASSFLGALAKGSVGAGAFALLLGFTCALVGGFVVLWQNHHDANEGEQSL